MLFLEKIIFIIIHLIALLVDILLLPLYYFIQKPGRAKYLSEKFKVEVTECSEWGITFKTRMKPSALHKQIVEERLQTIPELLNFYTKKFNCMRCLGTREIYGEEQEIQPNGKVFIKAILGKYIWKSFAQVEALAEKFGKGIKEIGVKSKERVAIFSETRYEFMIAVQGLFKQNISIVTVYATLGEEGIIHALNECDVNLVITSKSLLPKLISILPNVPKVNEIIYFEDNNKGDDSSGDTSVKIYKYADILKFGTTSKYKNSYPSENDVAIIMFTSGSSGTPKGVILTHHNIVSTVKAFMDYCSSFDVKKNNEMYMGFLPLAHVFEITVEMVVLSLGIPIGYSTPLTITDNSPKVKAGCKGDSTVLKPTITCAVPLILDRVSSAIQENVSHKGFISRALFKFGLSYKHFWIPRGFTTPLIDLIVFSKTKKIMGGRMHIIMTGGASLAENTQEFIQNTLCCKVIQGYGLTETTSCALVNDGYSLHVGEAGYPTTMNLVRLESRPENSYHVTDRPYPRGEIIVGGDTVAAGYYKLPNLTKESFYTRNGISWFKTGDIGEIRLNGTLKYVDRIKDMVKLQTGEYICLGKIETELKTCQLVDNVCVVPNTRKNYCIALIVPNLQRLTSKASGTSYVIEDGTTDLHESPEVYNLIYEDIINKTKERNFQKTEVPIKIIVCSETWTPENNLVTAAFKLKRNQLTSYYKNDIEEMFKAIDTSEK